MKKGYTAFGIGLIALILLRRNALKNQSVSFAANGLGLTAASLRKIGPKTDYAHLISHLGDADNITDRLKQNGTTEDTVNYMLDIVVKDHKDTEKLAKFLERKTVKETLENIFKFVFKYIQYEPDSKLAEQIRRPLRTLRDQKGDCDCYSILIGSILYNLKIPFKFRIAAYHRNLIGVPYFQHVYVIVPKPNGGFYTVDPVVDYFDYEKKPILLKQDFEL